jgi:hypothetical protein
MLNNIKCYISGNLLKSYLFMFCDNPKLTSYIIFIKCHKCKKKENITDYRNW